MAQVVLHALGTTNWLQRLDEQTEAYFGFLWFPLPVGWGQSMHQFLQPCLIRNETFRLGTSWNLFVLFDIFVCFVSFQRLTSFAQTAFGLFLDPGQDAGRPDLIRQESPRAFLI